LGWSYDFVGDLAETVSLIWPAAPGGEGHVPSLSEIVEQLKGASRAEVPRLLEPWLDALDATGRWALLKLVPRELRLGAARQNRARRMERCRARPHRGDLARPRAALPAALRLARRPPPAARDRQSADLHPADAGAAAGGRRHRRPRPARLSRRVEMGRDSRAA